MIYCITHSTATTEKEILQLKNTFPQQIIERSKNINPLKASIPPFVGCIEEKAIFLLLYFTPRHSID
jgi:hypothetical protein